MTDTCPSTVSSPARPPGMMTPVTPCARHARVISGVWVSRGDDDPGAEPEPAGLRVHPARPASSTNGRTPREQSPLPRGERVRTLGVFQPQHEVTSVASLPGTKRDVTYSGSSAGTAVLHSEWCSGTARPSRAGMVDLRGAGHGGWPGYGEDLWAVAAAESRSCRPAPGER